MAKNIKCSICNKDANVHLTQIVNNKVHKVDLCESCAQKKGVTDHEGFSLADLFIKQSPVVDTDKFQLQCPECNLTTKMFRRTGRLGCAHCYEVFKSLLLPMLEDMHEGISHQGKIPTTSINNQSNQLQLEKLQNFLSKAIAEEAYEEAAKYRDQIKEFKESKNLEV